MSGLREGGGPEPRKRKVSLVGPAGGALLPSQHSPQRLASWVAQL